MSKERSRPWQDPTPLAGFQPIWEGQFDSFTDWVSHAPRALTGFTDSNGADIKAICVDSLGRRCSNGKDFMRARNEKTFPVRYFVEGRIAPEVKTPSGDVPFSRLPKRLLRLLDEYPDVVAAFSGILRSARAHDAFARAALDTYGHHGPLVSGCVRDHFPGEVRMLLRGLAQSASSDRIATCRPKGMRLKTFHVIGQLVALRDGSGYYGPQPYRPLSQENSL